MISVQRRRWVALTATAVAGLFLLGAASDEERPMRAPLSPEDSAAAWALQSRHVAEKLGLPEEKAAELVSTFKEARQRLAKAWQERRGEARGEFAALRAKIGEPGSMPGDLTDREREELEAALSAFIPAMVAVTQDPAVTLQKE